MKVHAKDERLFEEALFSVARKTDRAFAVLFISQWILGVVLATTLSPLTWNGPANALHVHLYFAVFLGAFVAGPPILLGLLRPGTYSNRFVIATSQMIYSSLLIHLSGGRIETHFHIFGSLAFLTIYRDFKPIILASVITGLDHLIRGYFLPESVYGVALATPWRALEHSAWVLFEDAFLFVIIMTGLAELRKLCQRQAQTEETLLYVAERAQQRTMKLKETTDIVLQQQQQLLHSSRLSALGEMAGGIAHEINNPLAIILGRALQIKKAVDKAPPELEKVKNFAVDIEATAKRVEKIIIGLKTFSKDGEKTPFERVDIQTIIQDVLVLCKEKLKNKSVNLDISSRNCSVECRPIQIGQVLLNLLNNAYEAISLQKEKWISIDITEEGNKLTLAITDSGQGINEQVASRLGNPFFTTKSTGTGLGLSISRGIAESHHGSLALDRNSRNTRFVLVLPVSQPESPSVRRTA